MAQARNELLDELSNFAWEAVSPQAAFDFLQDAPDVASNIIDGMRISAKTHTAVAWEHEGMIMVETSPATEPYYDTWAEADEALQRIGWIVINPVKA